MEDCLQVVYAAFDAELASCSVVVQLCFAFCSSRSLLTGLTPLTDECCQTIDQCSHILGHLLPAIRSMCVMWWVFSLLFPRKFVQLRISCQRSSQLVWVLNAVICRDCAEQLRKQKSPID